MSSEVMIELNKVMEQRTRHCGREFLFYVRSATKQLKKILKEKEIPYCQRELRRLVEKWVVDLGGVPFDPTMPPGSPSIIYSVKRRRLNWLRLKK